MKRLLPLAVSVVIVVALTIALQSYLPIISEKVDHWFSASRTIPLEAFQARQISWPVTIHGTGELRPLKQVDVVSTIPGILEESRFKVGDPVTAGQVIASIGATELISRSREIEAGLKAAQIAEHEKESELSEAGKKLEKARELYKRDLIAAQDVGTAQADLAVARAQMELIQAQVSQQEAALGQLRYLLSFSKIVAPFTGVIIRRAVKTGAAVERGQPIMTLGALETMQVMIEVEKRDVDIIQRGMPAQVAVKDLPGQIFKGQVSGLSSDSAAIAGVTAEIQVPNSQKLIMSGMIASVSVPTKKTRVGLLIPNRAVVETEGKPSVAVLEADKLHERVITIGEQRGDMIEIPSGIREGEWIITDRRRPLPTNGRVSIATEKAAPGR